MTRSVFARLARLALGGMVVACFVSGVAFAALSPGQAILAANSLCDVVREAGPPGVVLFAVAQILVALSGALPAALMGAAAGAIYGMGFGFAIASVSMLLGAELAFRASRSLLRGFAERVIAGRSRMRDLDETIARDGWRIVCLLRISPVMPFSATSFALGLSSVRPRDYTIGTFAALPALFGYVFLGSLTKRGLEFGSTGASPLRLVFLGMGALATLALIVRVSRILRTVGLFQAKPRLSDA